MVQVGGPTDSSVIVGGAGVPSRPPEQELDSLGGGLLLATLFFSATPYRERIVDILRVIQGTQRGRELLHDFRTLAAQGKYPSLDLADPGEIPGREADNPQGLFLSQDALTAGASEIGLSPEEEHAPAVVLRLTQIRNFLALHGQNGQSNTSGMDVLDVPMDPEATAAVFRQELEAAAASRSKAAAIDPTVPGRSEQHAVLRRQSTGGANPYAAVTEPPPGSTGISSLETNGSPQEEHRIGPGGARRVFRWAERKVQAFRDFVLRRREPDGIEQPVEQTDRPIIKGATDPKTSRHKRTHSIRNFREINSAKTDTNTARPRSDTTHPTR